MSRQLLFKCNQVLIKKEAGKGQTDRALLAVYSSHKGWRDESRPKALDQFGLVRVCLKKDRKSQSERVRERESMYAYEFESMPQADWGGMRVAPAFGLLATCARLQASST